MYYPVVEGAKDTWYVGSIGEDWKWVTLFRTINLSNIKITKYFWGEKNIKLIQLITFIINSVK